MKTTVDYITKLANIPSPTGYTSHIMNYVIAELESFGYAPVRTNKGGVMVTVTGKDDSKHRVVTAHLDTLGAMVRAVKPDGRLKMDLIGGFVYNAIEGENCTIHVAKNGKKLVVQSLCTKLLFMSTKMLELLNAIKLTWKFVWTKK